MYALASIQGPRMPAEFLSVSTSSIVIRFICSNASIVSNTSRGPSVLNQRCFDANGVHPFLMQKKTVAPFYWSNSHLNQS